MLCETLQIVGVAETAARASPFVYYESIKQELKRRPIYECRYNERLKLNLRDLHVSHTQGVTGTGTPKDRDEVNRQEVYECDGLVCDLDVIGVPSKLSVIRKAEALTMLRGTLDLSCEENTVRWKWN